MAKPQFSNGSDYAFDATESHDFYYMWANTNAQSIASILTIRKNSTNEIIYSERQNSLILKHVLPSSILTNGVLYNATIQAVDRNNVVSSESDKILFYCYSKPNFNPTITQDQVIQSSTCTVGIAYSQSEGEELQMFKLELYNKNKELLYASNIKYDIASTVVFNDLTDNTTYYVKAIGQTINHMRIESELIPFHVDYLAPDVYAFLTAENRFEYGDIQLTSNIVSIEGIGADDNVIFEDHNYVDTINGTSVIFNKNFNIAKDFVLIIKGKDFKTNVPLLVMRNSKNKFQLCLINVDDTHETQMLKVIVTSNNLINIYYSNPLAIVGDIKIKLINHNNYIDAFLESEVS